MRMLHKKTKKINLSDSNDRVDEPGLSEAPKSIKRRIVRFARNVSIGIGVLLLVFLAAGVAYTWYMGKNNVAVEEEPLVSVDTNLPLIVPSIPAADATIGVSVQMLTSPIAPGSNATIAIKTNAKASCKITVFYNNIASTDSGLYEKIADEYGVASWTWTVEPSAPVGKWPVTVTCANEAKSAVVIGDLVIALETTAEN